jgi:hypothetical protein
MMMEKLVEYLARETEVLVLVPVPVQLCPPQTPHASPDANPGRRGGKPATNRLSYGAAVYKQYLYFILWV